MKRLNRLWPPNVDAQCQHGLIQSFTETSLQIIHCWSITRACAWKSKLFFMTHFLWSLPSQLKNNKCEQDKGRLRCARVIHRWWQKQLSLHLSKSPFHFCISYSVTLLSSHRALRSVCRDPRRPVSLAEGQCQDLFYSGLTTSSSWLKVLFWILFGRTFRSWVTLDVHYSQISNQICCFRHLGMHPLIWFITKIDLHVITCKR